MGSGSSTLAPGSPRSVTAGSDRDVRPTTTSWPAVTKRKKDYNEAAVIERLEARATATASHADAVDEAGSNTKAGAFALIRRTRLATLQRVRERSGATLLMGVLKPSLRSSYPTQDSTLAVAVGRRRYSLAAMTGLELEGVPAVRSSGAGWHVRRRGRLAVSTEPDPMRTSAQKKGASAFLTRNPNHKKDRATAHWLLRILASQPLFVAFTVRSLEVAVSWMVARRLKENEVLLEAGSEGDCMFVLEEGLLEISTPSDTKVAQPPSDEAGSAIIRRKNSRPRVIGALTPGDAFGELAMLYSTRRLSTVTAREACTVWRLDRDVYRVLMLADMAPNDALRKLLEPIPLLADLDTEQLDGIAKTLAPRRYTKGQPLLESDSDMVHVISAGVVRLGPPCGLGERDPTQQGSFTLRAGDILATGRSGDVSVLQVLQRTHTGGSHEATVQQRRRSSTERAAVQTMSKRRASETSLMGVAGRLFPYPALPQRTRGSSQVVVGADASNAVATCDVECWSCGLSEFAVQLAALPLVIYSRDGAAALLRNSHLTTGMSDAAIAMLAATARPSSFCSSDSPIIAPGRVATHLHLIISGEATIFRNCGHQEHEVRVLHHGAACGEWLLVGEEDAPSVFGLRCRKNMATLAFPVAAVRAQLSQATLQRLKQESLSRSASWSALKLSDLSVVALLGQGNYGRVALVRSSEGEAFALKVLDRGGITRQSQQAHLLSERKIMTELDHPFVLRLFATFKNAKSLFMLLEVCMGGELFHHLDEVDIVDEEAARFYVASITLVFEYLHERQIVYRDLKPENILLMPSGQIKVCDFGFAKKIADGDRSYTLCGTPEYIAPEMLAMLGHSRGVDWWALGIFLYELLHGYTPFTCKGEVTNPMFV